MINDRLRLERERLGLTQPAFAELASAKKRTLIDWEKGVSSPTAVQLAALVAAGVDGLFVLTGHRVATNLALAQLRTATEAAQRVAGPRDDQAEIQEVLFAQLQQVAARHSALLAAFDAADEDGKKLIEATAAMAARSKRGNER